MYRLIINLYNYFPFKIRRVGAEEQDRREHDLERGQQNQEHLDYREQDLVEKITYG